ncbi:MAG: TIGR01841 family phasin [Alphaproteobacteria bacterium]|nr:TIGR01841 family phasin [Alphaproteobacteria bacterium]
MMKSANPFAEMDLTKVMAEFKMPSFDVEALIQAQRKNFEAFVAANQLAVEGIQAVAKRQADIARETIEELTKASRDLGSATQAPDARMAKQVELAKSGYEKALANLRELSEMMLKSNNDAFGVINKRITEALDEVKHTVNGKANGKHHR